MRALRNQPSPSARNLSTLPYDFIPCEAFLSFLQVQHAAFDRPVERSRDFLDRGIWGSLVEARREYFNVSGGEGSSMRCLLTLKSPLPFLRTPTKPQTRPSIPLKWTCSYYTALCIHLSCKRWMYESQRRVIRYLEGILWSSSHKNYIYGPPLLFLSHKKGKILGRPVHYIREPCRKPPMCSCFHLAEREINQSVFVMCGHEKTCSEAFTAQCRSMARPPWLKKKREKSFLAL